MLCINKTLTISALRKTKNILKLLLNFARTLGFRGWGYFFVTNFYFTARMSKFRQVSHKYMIFLCLRHKTVEESDAFA